MEVKIGELDNEKRRVSMTLQNFLNVYGFKLSEFSKKSFWRCQPELKKCLHFQGYCAVIAKKQKMNKEPVKMQSISTNFTTTVNSFSNMKAPGMEELTGISSLEESALHGLPDLRQKDFPGIPMLFKNQEKTLDMPSFGRNCGKFSFRDRIIMGCTLEYGIDAKDIAEKYGCSPKTVYDNRKKADEWLGFLEEQRKRNTQNLFPVTQNFIRRIVLSLTLSGRCTNAQIREILKDVFSYSISTGTVSGIIKEASKRADIINRQISLEYIYQAGFDEIFQGNDKPCLVGVDLASTYVFLLELTLDRKKVTWETALEELRKNGLFPERSASDCCGAIISAVQEIWNNIQIQKDVFHGLYDLGRETYRIMNKAYKLIFQEDELRKEIRNAKYKVKEQKKEKLSRIQKEMGEKIALWDKVEPLCLEIQKLLGFTGLSFAQAKSAIEKVLDKLDKLLETNMKVKEQISSFRKKLPGMLNFLSEADKRFEKLAKKLNVPTEAVRLIYNLYYYGSDPCVSKKILKRISRLPGRSLDKWCEIIEGIKPIIENVKRASSMVENLNSVIRTFMNSKRNLPESFIPLLQLYINTRTIGRSRIKERIGKSRYELMTGNPVSFLDVIGY